MVKEVLDHLEEEPIDQLGCSSRRCSGLCPDTCSALTFVLCKKTHWRDPRRLITLPILYSVSTTYLPRTIGRMTTTESAGLQAMTQIGQVLGQENYINLYKPLCLNHLFLIATRSLSLIIFR